MPIVEPEILLDGDHDIATTASVQEWMLRRVYEALAMNGVFLESSLLKTSITTAGADCPVTPSSSRLILRVMSWMCSSGQRVYCQASNLFTPKLSLPRSTKGLHHGQILLSMCGGNSFILT